jgi:hypothetical protein
MRRTLCQWRFRWLMNPVGNINSNVSLRRVDVCTQAGRTVVDLRGVQAGLVAQRALVVVLHAPQQQSLRRNSGRCGAAHARTEGYGHTRLEVHQVLSAVVASFGSLPFLRLRMNSSFSERMDAAWRRFRC